MQLWHVNCYNISKCVLYIYFCIFLNVCNLQRVYSSAVSSCTLSCVLYLVKNQGNDKYKKSEYKVAIGQYHRALLYLKAIDASQKNPAGALLGQVSSTPLSPQLRHDVDKLYADCQSNLAGKVCSVILTFLLYYQFVPVFFVNTQIKCNITADILTLLQS